MLVPGGIHIKGGRYDWHNRRIRLLYLRRWSDVLLCESGVTMKPSLNLITVSATLYTVNSGTDPRYEYCGVVRRTARFGLNVR